MSTSRSTIDRDLGAAHLTVRGPTGEPVHDPAELDADAWILAAARELDDAVLRLRFDEPEIGTWVLHTDGDAGKVLAAEDLLRAHADHWAVNEVRLLWTRVLKRLDLSSRTLVALVEPGSCFAGVLAELAARRRPHASCSTATIRTASTRRPPSTSPTPTTAGSRCPTASPASPHGSGAAPTRSEAARAAIGKDLRAEAAADAELVTVTPDDIDWDDDVRLMLEERNSFSPDALTAMEANYRFVGPETMETKIFARLTAWQNWVFQRPNAVGPEGALQRFGTGARPTFDRTRV